MKYKQPIILVATALFSFVVFSPETFASMPWLIQLSKFAMIGGLAQMGIAAHGQARENADAIKAVDMKVTAVDDKVVDTHAAINGRMDQLVAASKAQGAQDQRAETRRDEADSKR